MCNKSTSSKQFIVNNDFMMNRLLTFSVTRIDFRQVLICWLVILFLWEIYWVQVVERNFSSVDFDKLLKIIFSLPAELYNEVHCSSMILYHTGTSFPE